MSTETKPSFEHWAILELKGHRTLAGRVTEEERFGRTLGRIDCPRPEGGFDTAYFEARSVYQLSLVSEEHARFVAEYNRPHVFPLLASTSPSVPALQHIEDYGDEDPYEHRLAGDDDKPRDVNGVEVPF